MAFCIQQLYVETINISVKIKQLAWQKQTLPFIVFTVKWKIDSEVVKN